MAVLVVECILFSKTNLCSNPTSKSECTAEEVRVAWQFSERVCPPTKLLRRLLGIRRGVQFLQAAARLIHFRKFDLLLSAVTGLLQPTQL